MFCDVGNFINQGLQVCEALLGLVLNGVVILVLLNFNKMNPHKLKLSILSLISTIIIAIIPTIGYQVDKNHGNYSFGFPAETLVYHGGWLFTFTSFGLKINFFFFYWIFKLMHKLWDAFTVPVKKDC